jgi:hypothetical protein
MWMSDVDAVERVEAWFIYLMKMSRVLCYEGALFGS